MKQLYFAIFVLSTLLCGTSFAEDFNCAQPQFGKPIANFAGFVKYKEKFGVKFYTHTGTCELTDLHESHSVSYGVIRGKLYAQFIQANGISRTKITTYFLKRAEQIGMATEPKVTTIDDWTIYTFQNSKSDLRAKVKINKKTDKGKLAIYYKPLQKFIEYK